MANLISRKYTLEYAGQTVGFPVIGKATFNADGSLDVADEKVKEFIEATEPSFDFKLKTAKKDKKDKEVEKKNETEEMLKGLKFEELVTLAKEAKIDAAKMIGWSDSKLRKELLKVLTAQE